MSGPTMQLVVDADVPLVHLVETFARCGLTLSNTGDYSFRVHRAETLASAAVAARPKVVYLAERKPYHEFPAPVSP